MHAYAAFGGSDAGSGAGPNLQRRLACREESRLIALAESMGYRRDGKGGMFLRWCEKLGALVPEIFGDDHPELKRSLSLVARDLQTAEAVILKFNADMKALGLE